MERTRCWLQATNITFLWWGWPWRCGYESRHQKQAHSWVDVEYNQEASSIPFSADFPAIHNCQVSKAVGECFKMPMEEFLLFCYVSGHQELPACILLLWHDGCMDGWIHHIFFYLDNQSTYTKKRCLFIKLKKKVRVISASPKTLRIQIRWSGPSGKFVLTLIWTSQRQGGKV